MNSESATVQQCHDAASRCRRGALSTCAGALLSSSTTGSTDLRDTDYLMNDSKVKRWVLAGTDYVYPRTTKILEAYLKAKGVKSEDIRINYTPFGHSDWQSIVSDIKKFGSQGVVSTISGDANVPLFL